MTEQTQRRRGDTAATGSVAESPGARTDWLGATAVVSGVATRVPAREATARFSPVYESPPRMTDSVRCANGTHS